MSCNADPNEQEFSAAEAMIQREGIAEIFDKLQPYTIMIANPATPINVTGPTKHMVARDSNIWRHLTSCMKGALLDKITGHNWNQWQVSSTHDYKPTVRLPGVPEDQFKARDEVMRFVFPKSTRFFADESTGRDRTEQALDSTAHILAIIQDNCSFEDSDEIIGELQFCYLTGMHLGNIACMEHWAHIVKVCNSLGLSFLKLCSP
jgi:A1 cistron-splicing factor AAR2